MQHEQMHYEDQRSRNYEKTNRALAADWNGSRSARPQRFDTRETGAVSETAAQSLGVLSLGLGSTLLLAPHAAAERIGLRPTHSALLRAIGVRELVSGLGLLARPDNPAWAWSRVAGDVMDFAVLAKEYRSSSTKAARRSLKTAALVVAGVAVADYLCATQLSDERQREDRPGWLRSGGLRSCRAKSRETRESVIINRTPEEIYEFWRDFSNLPRFMTHLQSVEVLDEHRSRWRVDIPGGELAWEAVITADEPNRRIAWRTTEAADIQHRGEALFEPTPGNRGTKVSVRVSYEPPAGKLGHAVAKLIGQDPGKKVRDDLQLLKRQLETGEIPTTRGQPAGRTQGETWLDRAISV